jgi:hypothetical protein
MSVVPRVVLAGGRAGPELAAQIQSQNRALARFNGALLLDLVVDALLSAEPASPISVVGDVPDRPEYRRIPDQGDFVANVLAGAGACADSDWMLVSSADMPFLTGQIVSEFVREARTAAEECDADLVYPIVPVSECYARYPDIKRTAIRVREGEFTGGNMVLARPAFFLTRRELLGRTYAARKKPLLLAAMLGAGTVGRLLLSQTLAPGALGIAMLEARVGALMNGKARAVVCHRPEIATDLDRPSDFAAAAAHARPDCPPAG